MTKRLSHPVLILSLILASAFPALAEFECAADAGYKWMKKNDKEAAPRSVAWSSLRARGASEAEAREKLGAIAARASAEAEIGCRKRHENLSECIAARFAQNGPLLGTLSFKARQALEDAITSDCQAQQGACEGAAVGEVKCREVAAPGEPPADQGEGKKDGGGKEKAGKEKGKEKAGKKK